MNSDEVDAGRRTGSCTVLLYFRAVQVVLENGQTPYKTRRQRVSQDRLIIFTKRFFLSPHPTGITNE
jgi:hypothetical protein